MRGRRGPVRVSESYLEGVTAAVDSEAGAQSCSLQRQTLGTQAPDTRRVLRQSATSFTTTPHRHSPNLVPSFLLVFLCLTFKIRYHNKCRRNRYSMTASTSHAWCTDWRRQLRTRPGLIKSSGPPPLLPYGSVLGQLCRYVKFVLNLSLHVPSLPYVQKVKHARKLLLTVESSDDASDS